MKAESRREYLAQGLLLLICFLLDQQLLHPFNFRCAVRLRLLVNHLRLRSAPSNTSLGHLQ